MKVTLPLLLGSIIILTGCQGVSSASETATKAPITLKYAPYNFLDDTPEDREFKAQQIQTAPDSRDFYAGKSVSAYGTWNSRTPLGHPNHSIDIHCLRYEGMEPYAHDRSFHSQGICIEAKATLDTKDNFLSANTNFYDISKWDFDEIVAVGSEEPYDCYRQELKFDRKNRTVTLLRTTVPGSDAAKCLIEPDAEPLLLHLGCPPAPWPVKSETHDGEYGKFTQYCLPDFDKMTQEQRDAFAEQL